jgi:hypothetical protein
MTGFSSERKTIRLKPRKRPTGCEVMVSSTILGDYPQRGFRGWPASSGVGRRLTATIIST